MRPAWFNQNFFHAQGPPQRSRLPQMPESTIPDNLTTQKVVHDWFYLLVGMYPNSEDISNLITNLNIKIKAIKEQEQNT